nr:iroquois class homeodomain protein IRX 2a [Hymenolepis microstoma]
MNMGRNYTEDHLFKTFISEDNYLKPDVWPRSPPTPLPRRESLMTYGVINRAESLNPSMSNQVYSHSSSSNYISEHPTAINTIFQHEYSLSQSYSGSDKSATIAYENVGLQNPPDHRFETEASGPSQKKNEEWALNPNLPFQELPSLQKSHFISGPPVNQTMSSLEVTRTQPPIFIGESMVQNSTAYAQGPFYPPVHHQGQSYAVPTPHMPRHPMAINQTPQTKWFPAHSRREFGAFQNSSNYEMASQIPPASVIEPEFHNSSTLRRSMLHVTLTYGQAWFNPPMPKQEFLASAPQGLMHDHYSGVSSMSQYLPKSYSGADVCVNSSYCQTISHNQSSPRIQTRNRREARELMKAWLDAHRDNPHPTYRQKLHFAHLTGLRKEQVENSIGYLRRKMRLEAMKMQMPSKPNTQSHSSANKAEKKDIEHPPSNQEDRMN